MDLGKPLARGLTADVYPWGEGYVLKLFHRFTRETVEYEARIGRAVHAAGLSVPAVGDVIDFGGRVGLTFERIDGTPMVRLLGKQPWRFAGLARRLAEVHSQLHLRSVGADLPDQRERLAHKLRQAAALPSEVRVALLESLAAMPGGDRICHGDFHPGNILLTAQGDVVIDWIDATRGNPLADVARTTILLLGAAGVERNPFMKVFIRLFHALYLRHYFRLSPGGEAEYRHWLPIVAGARLSESIPELEDWLRRYASHAIRSK